MAKYGKAAQKRVKSAMHRRKKGTLKSSSGATVKSRKQAIAIGLSEAREKGGKVPTEAEDRASARRRASAPPRSADRLDVRNYRDATGSRSAKTRLILPAEHVHDPRPAAIAVALDPDQVRARLQVARARSGVWPASLCRLTRTCAARATRRSKACRRNQLAGGGGCGSSRRRRVRRPACRFRWLRRWCSRFYGQPAQLGRTPRTRCGRGAHDDRTAVRRSA